MEANRLTACALAGALVVSLAGAASAQGAPNTPSASSPARATSQSSPSRGRASDAQAPAGATTDPSRTGTTGSTAIPGGVPAMGGVTPNRAELAESAFRKLDGANRGYLLRDDVRQLEGFDRAFREADRNTDGRLDASEFSTAWRIYTGNTR